MYCIKCGKEVSGNFCPYCGTKIKNVENSKNQIIVTNNNDNIQHIKKDNIVSENTFVFDKNIKSHFDGGILGYFGVNFLVVFVSLITLFLAFPAMICFYQKWIAKHTYINGKRMVFDGNGIQLFGKFILWLFLSIITLGIYSIFLMVKVKKWLVSHTHYEGMQGKSQFTGGTFSLFFVRLWAGIVTIITLGLVYYWAQCFIQRYMARHTIIDGYKQEFDGKGIQLFCKGIIWIILTLITFGIYGLWYTLNMKKWLTLHTNSLDNGINNLPQTNCIQPQSIDQPKADISAQQKNKYKKIGFVIFIVMFAINILSCLSTIIEYIGLKIINQNNANTVIYMPLFLIIVLIVIAILSIIGLINTIKSLKGNSKFNKKVAFASIILRIMMVFIGIINSIISIRNIILIGVDLTIMNILAVIQNIISLGLWIAGLAVANNFVNKSMLPIENKESESHQNSLTENYVNNKISNDNDINNITEHK